MMRTALTATMASLSLLTACQQPEPAMPEDADALQAEPAPVAEVAASDAAADAEAPAPPSSPRAEGAPARSRGEGPPRGPQTLADMERRTEERFARLDANNDGVVTMAEIEAAGGRGGRMLMRSDADGDGRITRAEARAGTADVFRRMDANGDGVISEDERPQRGGPGSPRGPEN